MIKNRLNHMGNNKKPISHCKIDEQTATALIEFSTIEECECFSVLNKIPILEKECIIEKLYKNN